MVDSKKTQKKSPINITDKPQKSKSAKAFKFLLSVLVLVLIAGGLLGVSIFLGFFDLQNFAKEHNLQSYPIIGSYFTEPKTNFSPVELDLGDNSAGQSSVDANLPQTPNVLPQPVDPNNPVVTGPNGETLDIKKIEKQKQQEEAKRISKAARYYSSMKPDEAVPILNRLDDDTVVAILSKMEDDQVAKILAAFDAGRAARLTQMILIGQTQRSQGI